MNEPVIQTKELIKRFGTQTVLKGVNLDVRKGETMVVMGGSGCGKSTILRMMIGSLMPTSGSVELFGEDLATLDESELNETRKRFGILFQSGALFNSMTIADNVSLPLHEHTELDPNIIDIQVKIKLELVGLSKCGSGRWYSDWGIGFPVQFGLDGLHPQVILDVLLALIHLCSVSFHNFGGFGHCGRSFCLVFHN